MNVRLYYVFRVVSCHIYKHKVSIALHSSSRCCVVARFCPIRFGSLHYFFIRVCQITTQFIPHFRLTRRNYRRIEHGILNFLATHVIYGKILVLRLPLLFFIGCATSTQKKSKICLFSMEEKKSQCVGFSFRHRKQSLQPTTTPHQSSECAFVWGSA